MSQVKNISKQQKKNLHWTTNIVHQKVSLHPSIVCDTVNVCHLVQSDTSQKLSLAKLKEICAFLDIDTADILAKGRKRPLIKKIKAFTEDCSCHSK